MCFALTSMLPSGSVIRSSSLSRSRASWTISTAATRSDLSMGVGGHLTRAIDLQEPEQRLRARALDKAMGVGNSDKLRLFLALYFVGALARQSTGADWFCWCRRGRDRTGVSPRLPDRPRGSVRRRRSAGQSTPRRQKRSQVYASAPTAPPSKPPPPAEEPAVGVHCSGGAARFM